MKNRLVVFSLIVLILSLAAKPSTGYTQEEEHFLRDQIDSYLNGLVESGFSGAVLVAKGEEILLHEGYGLANDAYQLPVTFDTVFLFGSITKQFTATAILHLEMQGLLNTEDQIGKYFDAVPRDKAGITVHQLLTHSSGLRHNVLDNSFIEIARDDVVRQILEADLLFEPGTGVSYSNDGFILLAAIVEIASGQSWQSYLKTHLFLSAGLEHTGFFNEAQWEGQSVANGYYSGHDEGSPANWPGPYWSLIGSGGVMTTVEDMYRWYMALQDGIALSAEEREKLWTPYESISGRSSYGYGWIVIETEDQGTIIETTGAGTSHNAYFHSSLGGDLVVIVASNRIDEPLLSRWGLVEFEETLYAVQVGDMLVENISSGDFAPLPEFARSRARPLRPTLLGFAVIGLAAMLLLIGIWVVSRRRLVG